MALTSMTQAPEAMESNPHSKNETSELSADTVIAGSGGGKAGQTPPGANERSRRYVPLSNAREAFSVKSIVSSAETTTLLETRRTISLVLFQGDRALFRPHMIDALSHEDGIIVSTVAKPPQTR